MVEQTTQRDLVNILPKLHDDLAAGNLETLSEYKVSYSFEPEEPASAVEKYILRQFCDRAASDLATQRGREYGFGSKSDSGASRATAVHLLNPEELEYLPTNNLDCERDLAKFDKLAARSAACSNRSFTAKGIRDEMTLYKSDVVTIDKATQRIARVLDEREKKWVKEQNLLTQDRLEKVCRAALKAEEYVHVLLHKCKSWGGPFTTTDELEQCVLSKPDDDALKAMLRTEVAYRRHTSPRDYQERSSLYRLNQISTTELKMNLTLILTTEAESSQATPDLPTEEDMKIAFKLHGGNEPTESEETCQASVPESTQEQEVEVNEPCIVIWDINNKRQWYVGICISDHKDGTYTVEHLEQCDPHNMRRWKHPTHADIQTVSIVQIIPCNIIGSWDLTKRVMTFILENWHMIDILFKSFY